MWIRVVEIVALILVCGVGTVLAALRLPGTWLIVAAAVADQWWRHWPAPWLLYTLIAAAVVAEIVEFAASAMSARRAGGSRQAAWGGLIGGIAGMFIFSIPLPIVGSMIGAVLGCFIGAAAMEIHARNRVFHGARVGYFAAMGMVLGTVSKIAAALMMSALLVGTVLLGGK